MNLLYIVKISLLTFGLWTIICLAWRVFFLPSGIYDIGTFLFALFFTGVYVGWKSKQLYKTQTLLAMLFFLAHFVLLTIVIAALSYT